MFWPAAEMADMKDNLTKVTLQNSHLQTEMAAITKDIAGLSAKVASLHAENRGI